MELKNLDTAHLAHQTVLVRLDLDVPLEEKAGSWHITDPTRIEAGISTLQALLQAQCKVVVIGHLGRPEAGQPTPDTSLIHLKSTLAELLHQEIGWMDNCIGSEVEQAKTNLQPGQALLLENLRYHQGEEANDPTFAQALAQGCQAYVNNAFSVCHRQHASVVAVTEFLPAWAGLNLTQEIAALTQVRDNPERPLVVVIGGAKISDKVEAVSNLAHLADVILIGGGVANNFLKAEGLEIHKSYLQDASSDLKKQGVDYVHVAKDLLDQLQTEKVWVSDFIPVPKILYPLDVMAAPNPDSQEIQTIDLTHDAQDTPDDLDLMYLDIGPKTIQLYQLLINQAKTVFWNGPMGYFEKPQFARGTQDIAQAIADCAGKSIIGGGDTLAAVEAFGLKDRMDFISTAGGASLDFLAGKSLPGLIPLEINTNPSSS